jgi:hypothetical protein
LVADVRPTGPWVQGVMATPDLRGVPWELM